MAVMQDPKQPIRPLGPIVISRDTRAWFVVSGIQWLSGTMFPNPEDALKQAKITLVHNAILSAGVPNGTTTYECAAAIAAQWEMLGEAMAMIQPLPASPGRKAKIRKKQAKA